MVNYKKTLVVYALIIISSLPVVAQVDLSYNGPFEVAGYQGMAVFDFRIEKSDTVYNGPFMMQNADINKLISSVDNSFSFKGNFNQNLPSEKWTMKFGKYSIADSSEVSDYTYHIKVNGQRHEAVGLMNKGKPNGKWLHIVNEVENSRVVNTFFKSEITFENGIPQRSFRIEDKDYIMVGRFLRDGHAHDLWELYSTQGSGAIESWYFTDGKLNKVVIDNEDFADTLMVYDQKIENPVLTNLDDRYLKIINLRNQVVHHAKGKWQSGIKVLLDENASYYKRINDIISDLGSSDFMPEFKVKTERLPLSEAEMESLKEIQDFHEKSSAISSSLLGSSQLNILKLADEEVLFLLSVLDKLDSDYLKTLGSLIEYNEDSILAYIPRDHLIPGLIKPQTEISVSYSFSDSIKTKSFKGPKANEYSFEEGGLNVVSELAEYTFLSIDSVQKALDKKLKIEEREQLLMELEEQLVLEFTTLNELIDSLRIEVSGKYDKALKEIKSSAKKELSSYSSKTGLSGKAEDARALKTCFKETGKLSISLSQLPVKWEEIKEAYTDQVWNPFTSTVMDEELKSNITGAYRDVLIPYFLEKAENSACGNAKPLNNMLQTVHQRMMEMLKEDTSKVERKLKRENDPATVLELFGVDVEIESES